LTLFMVKIRVRSGRGTRIIEVDSDASKWTGKQFREIQAARKEAAIKTRTTYITSGRGTGRKVFKDIPEPKARPDTKGMTRSTGRGTSSRKSKGHK